MMLERPDKRRRAADRERQRACRARQRRHCAAYRVEAGAAELDMLVALGYLKDADADDPRKVGAAIGELLAESARE